MIKKNIINPTFVILFMFFCFILLLCYIKIWENRQPKFLIENAKIHQILPYHKGGGDLHWTLNGIRIYIENDLRPIDFPSKNWNDSIKVGSEVNLIVRKSFFGNELDGIEISLAISK